MMKTAIQRCIFLLTGFLLVVSFSIAQDTRLNFSVLTSKDGLSSNTVNAILKDQYGFLWFATEDGLNRFDGKNFRIYRHKADDPSSIRANHVTALYEDKLGVLWVGTNGGSLSIYNRKTDSFFNFSSIPGYVIGGAVTSISGDNYNNVWVSCYDGLFSIDIVTRKATRIPTGEKKAGKPDTKVFTLTYQDRKHQMWFGSDKGLYHYNSKTGVFTLLGHNDNENSLAANNVLSIAEDRNQNLWIGTTGGLSKLNSDGKTFTNFKHTIGKNGLSSDVIYAIARDFNSDLWLATEEGLDILNTETCIITNYKPDIHNKGSLSSRSIRSIYIDKQGIYWLGTFQGGVNKYDKNFSYFNLRESNPFDSRGLSAPVITSFAEWKGKGIFIGTDGGGLNLYHPETSLFDHLSIASKRAGAAHDLAILALKMAKNGQLWIGTYRDGLFKYDPATGSYRQLKKGNGKLDLNFNDIFCIEEDTKGNIWIGTNGGGINIYNPNSQIVDKIKNDFSKANDTRYPANNNIRAFAEDHNGNMWVGTFGGGISVWNPATRRFKFYNNTHNNLNNDYVFSIAEDSLGRMWAGTGGGGLNLLDNVTDKFVSFSESDGLANDVVQKILEDSCGKLWVSTNQGISSFDAKNKRFTNYSHYNGLQNNSFVHGAGLRASSGELYFGGQEGFNYFNPLAMKKNKNIPPVMLIDLKVDDKSVIPTDKGPIQVPILLAKEIQLEYSQNIAISFVALNYTNSQQNVYKYRLIGFNQEWVTAGKEHTASYNNLNPGTYEFQVIASNNNGLWNNTGRSIKIVVAPPFWLSIYAFITYLTAGVALLFYIRHRGIHKLKTQFALEQERQQAKQTIESQKREAEHMRELDQLKIKFLTNLSHEFRTPISLIVGPVDNLLDKIDEPELAGQLGLIKRNGRRLLNLVNQLLDFRKMEEAELKLKLSRGEIVQFIREVTDSFTDLADRKKINLKFTTANNPVFVFFDANKVERILFNLLSNAFKFTEEGGNITVELTIKEFEDTDIVNVTCSVTDTGIGIPSNVLQKVFDRFFQSETGPAILNQGSGIGLSITREFVKMHGGKISAESENGKGSRFIFEIPLQIATAETKTATTPKPDTVTTEIDKAPDPNTAELPANELANKPTILIIEDDEDFRFYLKDNLKSQYRIYEASNGKEGWQMALSRHPDVVVSDIKMPLMTGTDLSKKLKSDKRTLHIPVILLTASNAESDQIKGLESGANDFISKPFNFAVLQVKIKNLLTQSRSARETYSRQLQVTAGNVVIESENEKFLNKVMQYVERNLNDPQLSVEGLSRELVMSRVSLYKKLLDITGMSPVEFIRAVKLEKAIVLLEKSDMNIAQIAYQTGFSTPNYFTKAFKEKYNMLPSEYIEAKRKLQEEA